MKILAIERDLPEAPEGPGPLRDEAARVWQLYQAGMIREAYFRGDRPNAVLVLEAADVDDARGALDTLPLVAAGYIAFELVPLAPYPGFARLFEGSDEG